MGMMGPTQDKFEVSRKDCHSANIPINLLISEYNLILNDFKFQRFLVILRVKFNVLPRLQSILTDPQQRSYSAKILEKQFQMIAQQLICMQ